MARRLRKSVRSFFAAALFAGFGFVAVVQPAAADPGLWVAKGPHATVYLFGTIHVLRKGQSWKSPAVAAALAASQEIWLEVPHLNDEAQTRRVTEQLGFDPQHPLSTVLSHKDLARLDRVAKAIGVAQGEKAFEPMRPWLVAVALEGALIKHAGYDPQSGVEEQLLRDKAVAGKPVRGFETFAEQMHFFADLGEKREIDLLDNTLGDFDKGATDLNALVVAWSHGDQAAIAHIMVDELKGPFPALYRTILVDRNAAWAKKIAALLRGSGVDFVAVGAAHLAGPDSVQHMLERRGATVTRVSAMN
jgi:uncharacterized protein